MYEARTIITKDGEEKPADKTQKSEKHCKKVGALSEAESLAKSFKSVRSKKSTKSSRKSAKSTKSSHKSGKSMKKKTSKEENVDEPRNADENQEEHGGQKADAKSGKSRKSSRTDGGREGARCVVDMDQHEVERENTGENVLKKVSFLEGSICALPEFSSVERTCKRALLKIEWLRSKCALPEFRSAHLLLLARHA